MPLNDFMICFLKREGAMTHPAVPLISGLAGKESRNAALIRLP
jgi:hypothetical protein